MFLSLRLSWSRLRQRYMYAQPKHVRYKNNNDDDHHHHQGAPRPTRNHGWDVVASWLRRGLSTGGSWVRLPLYPPHRQCSNCRGVGGLNSPTSPGRPPYLWSKFDPGGSSFNPHLSFAEVGMLLDSHFLLMQFLKYQGLHHDDLNVTTS